MTFVGVCGGRDFADKALMAEVLERECNGKDVIIQGGARGADLMAKAYAENYGLLTVTCHAPWGTHGNAAGPMRNAVIAALPLRLLIAFPGDRGTADMVKKAKAAGIPVVEVKAS